MGQSRFAWFTLAAALLMSIPALAQNTFFTPGNLVVAVEGCGVHAGTCTNVTNGTGNGTGNSSVGGYGDNQAAPLTLFQYTPLGTTSVSYVNSLVLQATASGANVPLSGEYGSSSEATIHLSGAGQYLTILGYGVNAGAFNANPGLYGAAPSNALAQSGSLPTTTLSATVDSLPVNGSTVYVTLYWLINGSWVSNPYTFTAFNEGGAQGVLTTPAPGSTFTGGSVTFDWTAGVGASNYWLDVGSTRGGNQYSQSGPLGNVLTTTVNGLPTDSSTVYVTLYTLVGGQWFGTGYTYTAFNASSGLAAMQSPTPGSTLSGNFATFTWSQDPNATAYWMDVGSSPGGNTYYQSGNLGNMLTTTVYSLPANGSTIYVTLYSLVNGQWLNNRYTYTSGP